MSTALGRGIMAVLGIFSFTAFLTLMRAVMLYLGPFFLALLLGVGRRGTFTG